jgi:hypothetical protein
MNLLDLATFRNGVRTLRASSWDRSGRNRDWWTIPPGESRVLADLRGPGLITHLWFTQKRGYRDCLLKITWDDAPAPSVLCPLGDFFCLGHDIVNTFQSLLFTASTHATRANRLGADAPSPGSPGEFIEHKGCALNSYVPMPYRQRCVIELVNEGTLPQEQFFFIDYELHPAGLSENLGYFHAEFHRSNPFRGWAPEIAVNTPEVDVPNLGRAAWRDNYLILSARGRGHYLGCNLSVTNFAGTWWGEGDDMIWVDGYKWPPDLHGTGSEDYFGQAWSMQPNAFLRNGTSLFEYQTGGYQTSYVFHLENPVRFEREIRVTIEHGHANHLANEMSSVAYWYIDQPSAAATPPPVAQRQAVPRSSTGAWLNAPDIQCPGPPVPLNPQRRAHKAAWKKRRKTS